MKFEKLLLNLAILAFAGCATYNKSPTPTYESKEDASVSRIAGGDNKTKNIVVINSLKNQISGKLHAKVEVQNQSSKPSIFLYRFDWVSEDGSVENSPVWLNATINGKEMQTLQAVDPRGNAVDFRLVLKGT